MKIAVIGSLNMDTTVVTQNLPNTGETILATGLYQSFGGKGANQAIAAARLGGDVAMVGYIGLDANGQAYLAQLEQEAIDTSMVCGVKTATGVAFITVDAQGSNTIVVYPGANHEVSKKQIDDNWHKISLADIIILQFEIPMETIEYVIEKAAQENKIILVNPAPFQAVSEKIYPLLTYFTPNETELEKLTQTADLQAGINLLLNKGVANVIVTLGDKGCIWTTKDDSIHFPAYHVDAIDTTAAGDCFNGALAVALTKFEDKQQIVAFANQAAALSVMKKGAVTSSPTLKEMEENKELFQ